MITNDDIFERAQDIAERRRDGGSFVKYIDAARDELLRQPTEQLKKIVKYSFKDEALRKKAALAAQARRMPGIGSVDPDRRLEIGDCETSLGRVRVSISADSINIHGANVLLADIDKDLRDAVVTSSAGFSAAENDSEQVEQRAIIGLVMDAVMRRHEFVSTRVKAAKQNERYGV
jgi:hypothetical protein